MPCHRRSRREQEEEGGGGQNKGTTIGAHTSLMGRRCEPVA